jgi:Phage integrase family
MATLGDGRVFMTDRQLRSQAERAGKRRTELGMERLTLNDARHTYTSLIIAAGVNAQAVSTLMGHVNIGITSTSAATCCAAQRPKLPKTAGSGCRQSPDCRAVGGAALPPDRSAPCGATALEGSVPPRI